MKLKSHSKLTYMIMMLCLLLFVGVAYTIGGNRVTFFDDPIISYIQAAESPAWTRVMKWFTAIGSGKVMTIIAMGTLVILFVIFKHRQELILFCGVVLGSEFMNIMLKNIFRRARPDLHRLIEIEGYSFPSGHSMVAFSFYGILTYLLWRHTRPRIARIILLISSACMILLIGVSRIYLGVHYPSDVIGGYLASSMWLLICVIGFERYKKR
ncbi:undecaprenyl-diphosphatase [Paenibacillus sp. DS2015]|uniref:phosphatase PAP2 family protein n=1 Tax=Paenibacillus sp. DS2015 TaxID=3373917 RepID=UPI003D24FD36